MKSNPEANAIIMKAVKDQLESPESPYVKKAFNRLVKDGYSKDKVMNMLGAVLSTEMWEITVTKRSFDEEAYIKRLEGLPDMSWLDQ